MVGGGGVEQERERGRENGWVENGYSSEKKDKWPQPSECLLASNSWNSTASTERP